MVGFDNSQPGLANLFMLVKKSFYQSNGFAFANFRQIKVSYFRQIKLSCEIYQYDEMAVAL